MKQTTAALIKSVPLFPQMIEAIPLQHPFYPLSDADPMHTFDCVFDFRVCNLRSELLYQSTLLLGPLLISDTLDGRNGEHDSGARLSIDTSKIQEPHRKSERRFCD